MSRFRRLLAAAVVSGLGDQVNRVAVVALLITSTGSTVAVASVLALRLSMQLLVGPLAATLADRLPRRRIMIGADLGRAAVAPLLLACSGGRNLWLLFAVVAALEAGSALFGPARSASIPSLVPPDSLVRANSLDTGAAGLVMASGSFAGGALTAWLGFSFAFVVNAATFVVSALLVATVPIPAVAAGRDIGSRLRDVVPVIRRIRTLRLVLVLVACWPLAGGAFSVLIPAYATRAFDGGAELGVGALYGALGLGYLTGGALAHRASGRIAPQALLISACSFIAEGAFHLATSTAPNLVWGCAFMAAAAAGGGIGNAAETTVLMRAAPAAVLGRLFGLTQTVSAVGQVVAMLAAGLLLTVAGPRPVGAGAGLLLAVTGIAVATLVRRPGPTAESAEDGHDP